MAAEEDAATRAEPVRTASIGVWPQPDVAEMHRHSAASRQRIERSLRTIARALEVVQEARIAPHHDAGETAE
jgi:hypothetical protein